MRRSLAIFAVWVSGWCGMVASTPGMAHPNWAGLLCFALLVGGMLELKR